MLRCPLCGLECADGAVFCKFCGTAIPGSRANRQGEEKAPPEPAAPPETAASYDARQTEDERAPERDTPRFSPRPPETASPAPVTPLPFSAETEAPAPAAPPPLFPEKVPSPPPQPFRPAPPAPTEGYYQTETPPPPQTEASYTIQAEPSHPPQTQPPEPVQAEPPRYYPFGTEAGQTPYAETADNASRPALHVQEAPRPLTARQFFLIELVSLIPLVNIIFLCILAFSSRGNPNRVRLAQAKLSLMMFVAALVLLAVAALLLLIATDVIDGLYLGNWAFGF